MATRKGRRGPDIKKYVLTVDARSGKVLHTEIEDPVTRERRPAGKVEFAYGVSGGKDPGDSATGLGIVAPGTRSNRPIFSSRIAPIILPSPMAKRGK
jgi:hypothetical protein